ncbi:MAG: hypothetical protein ACJAX5_000568 [Patiriisocius sp.]|jgi:hypothetical protein
MSIIKFVLPLTRKAGMTKEAFREYYEQHHRLIGEKYLKDYVVKYVRRYVSPMTGEESSTDFDVLLEIWYRDSDSFKACMKYLATQEIAAEIAADEEKLFDGSKKRGYLINEAESDFTET